MKILHTIAEFRAWRSSLPSQAITPFVPTMGALHDGHASLLRCALQIHPTSPNLSVMASIFANPTQFGPNEDFQKYPRTLDADIQILQATGCAAVFVPSAQEMYPDIEQLSTQHSARGTSIDPGPLADVLEGAIRPGHFRGVCTVVIKLLNIVQPSHLLLGQKDYQQQAILRHMVADLNLPVEVITCPTIREPDGLAMSSRNRYLSSTDRPRAAAIHQAMLQAQQAFANSERNAPRLEAAMHAHLAKNGLDIQYALVAHAQTLQPWNKAGDKTIAGPAVILIAAKLGSTRLIDNLLLG